MAFLRRGRAAKADGGGSVSDIVFCRLVLLEAEVFAGSVSRAGLGSRPGTFRFRDGGGGRIDGTGADARTAEVPAEDSGELAALADARVIRELEEDISIWF